MRLLVFAAGLALGLALANSEYARLAWRLLTEPH